MLDELKYALRSSACLIALLIGIVGTVSAQSTGHYQLGSNGMYSAVVPQVRDHSFKTLTGLYYASKYAMDDGSEVGVNGNIEVLFGEFKYRFMTGRRLLGGNYGFAFNFIFAEADFNVASPDIQEGPVGVGDPEVTPLILGWESGHLYGMFEYSFYIPIGRYDEDAVDNVGKGYWSHLFSLGGTGYAGADSTWSGTLIARYEHNMKLKDRDLKPGDDIILEVAIGKRLWGAFDLGAVGYGAWQITEHSGSAVSPEASGEKNSVLAAGIELTLIVPDQPVEIKWRTYSQFAARNRFRGYESMLELFFYF